MGKNDNYNSNGKSNNTNENDNNIHHYNNKDALLNSQSLIITHSVLPECAISVGRAVVS